MGAVIASDTVPRAAVGAAREACRHWYAGARRDLPWRRHAHDPYAVWVSEIMLQQTRADVVAPRFERFLARFPTVAALAGAAPRAVVAEWAGLGYYARARNLHAAARRVVREHGGRLPRRALESLPGIGRYTAGAIRSIAWGEPEPILDGNVQRVFARLFGVDGSDAATRTRQWELALAWARGRDPGSANQALMELGATVCVKPRPRCEVCPVADRCFARSRGLELELPAPRRRAAARRVALALLAIEDGGRLLLVRRRDGRLLRGLWELPAVAGPPGAAAWARAGERLAFALAPPRERGRVRHAILEHAIEAAVYATGPAAAAAALPAAAAAPPAASPAAIAPKRAPLAILDAGAFETRWFRPRACRDAPLATLTVKALAKAAETEPRFAAFVPDRVRARPPAR